MILYLISNTKAESSVFMCYLIQLGGIQKVEKYLLLNIFKQCLNEKNDLSYNCKCVHIY